MTSQNHQESSCSTEDIFSTLDQLEKTLEGQHLFSEDAVKSIILELKNSVVREVELLAAKEERSTEFSTDQRLQILALASEVAISPNDVGDVYREMFSLITEEKAS